MVISIDVRRSPSEPCVGPTKSTTRGPLVVGGYSSLEGVAPGIVCAPAVHATGIGHRGWRLRAILLASVRLPARRGPGPRTAPCAVGAVASMKAIAANRVPAAWAYVHTATFLRHSVS